jgi:rod shape-determining protein MreC
MRDSRRARIVLAVLLLIAATFVIIDLRGGSSAARGAGSSVFGPLERAVTTVTEPIGNFFSAIGGIGRNAQKVDELQAQNDELQTRLRELESDAARADQLDALFGLAGKGRYRIVPAQVIAVGPTQGFAYTVTIDVGQRDGIRRDQTVINGQGLVGRVTAIGRSSSTVLLIIDPTSSVGARLAKTRQIGFVNGRGAADLELQLLNPRAPLAEGDALVSFGAQASPFVPGVPIGTVTSVRGTPGSLTRIARVRPYVDMTSLDLVGVVLGRPAVSPRDSLIPPSPTPSPTVPSTTAPPSTPTPAPRSTTSPTPTARPTSTGGN